MSKQNIFDNDNFFESYMEVRHKGDSYNNLIEQPAIMALLPDLTGKVVLDIGCGSGGTCMNFINMGAAKVVGIDISENMLNVAREKNAHPDIEYMNLGMEQLDKIGKKFDLVYSSMAAHYAADFEQLALDVSGILNDGGVFLFSQEHPMVTAPLGGATWVKDENDVKIAAPVSNYLENGQRTAKWLGNDVVKHHRSFSAIANALIVANLVIAKVIEPEPSPLTLEIAPHMYDEAHRPTSIIFKAQK